MVAACGLASLQVQPCPHASHQQLVQGKSLLLGEAVPTGVDVPPSLELFEYFWKTSPSIGGRVFSRMMLIHFAEERLLPTVSQIHIFLLTPSNINKYFFNLPKKKTEQFFFCSIKADKKQMDVLSCYCCCYCIFQF